MSLAHRCLHDHGGDVRKAAAAALALRSTEKKHTWDLEGEKIVTYALLEGEFIPWEEHADETQMIHVIDGHLRADLDLESREATEGGVLIIPRGARHRITALAPSRAWSEYSER